MNPLDFLPYARCLDTLSLNLIIAADQVHPKPHLVIRKLSPRRLCKVQDDMAQE